MCCDEPVEPAFEEKHPQLMIGLAADAITMATATSQFIGNDI